MAFRFFAIYSVAFLPPFLHSSGRVGPGATDQAAGTHSLISDAAPSVPAVFNTVRAVLLRVYCSTKRAFDIICSQVSPFTAEN